MHFARLPLVARECSEGDGERWRRVHFDKRLAGVSDAFGLEFLPSTKYDGICGMGLGSISVDRMYTPVKGMLDAGVEPFLPLVWQRGDHQWLDDAVIPPS